jgi:type IV secretion system protein VirB10
VRQQIDAATERDDPTAAYKSRLAQLQASGMAASGGAGSGSAPQLLQTAAGKNSLAQFANAGQGDRWKLDSQPEAPRSPYELRAGFVLPATLISGINSDLPGQIVAQVAQHVYDTPTGKYLLIPQGARLVGSYSSEVAYGQARVLVAWQRIVFPDGKAMDIGAMPGADGAGYAGLHDQVNNHYLRLFGSAFLMSGVTAGITYTQRRNEAGNLYGAPSASSALSEALGQQLGQVTAQLIAKNMNIAPTLEIRPGLRFNVVVTRDMTFSKPYRAFDY